MSATVSQDLIDSVRATEPQAAKLLEHFGHDIEVGIYVDQMKWPDHAFPADAELVNVSLECMDCFEVIDTYDITTGFER